MKTSIKNNPEQTIVRVTREAKLLEFLYEALSQQSRKSVKALLEQKRIMINNKIITAFDYPLEPDIKITILKKNAGREVSLRKMNLIYEDESFIIIDKACGLLSVAAQKENEETAFSILNSYVKQTNRNAQLYVVHRLDRETSGVMMFSKNRDIQQMLQDNWDSAVTKRIYYAVVEGSVEKDDGEIVSWLKENASLKVYSSHIPGDGQKAVTKYHVVRKTRQFSLLEVSLETGRKNQIRVHLQDIGHSIAGDKKYGAVTDPLRRLALHAGILEFTHPATGECMHFETPVPKTFNNLLR
jgi:23S rRNA pseudouridine1911/1915/1917 synthase